MIHKQLTILLAAALATACAPETPEGDGVSAAGGQGGASTGQSGGGGGAGKPAAGGTAGVGASSGTAGATGGAGTVGGAAGAAGTTAAGASGSSSAGAGGAGAGGLAGSSAGGAAAAGTAGQGGAAAGSSAAGGSAGSAGSTAGAAGAAAGGGAAGSAGTAGSAVGTAMHPGTVIKLTVVSMDWSGNQTPSCFGGTPLHLMLSFTILGKPYGGGSTCFKNDYKCDELDTGVTVTGLHLSDIQAINSNATYTLSNDQRSSGGTITKCKTDWFLLPTPLIISADNEYVPASPAQIRVRIEKM